MTELRLERFFKADIDRVFAYVTQAEHLLEWWGPEGVTVPEHQLDLGRKGPWYSVMHSPEGKVHKVSGQVTQVEPPHRVGFTWAWHDETDARGHESHVLIELAARDGGTAFAMTHAGLRDEDAAAAHNEGWTSSLRKLVRAVETAAADAAKTA